MGRRVGEWHAPSVTAHCLSNLINRNLTMGLRSCCVLDMTVNADAIGQLLDGSKVLVWLPMRLGVERLNSMYVEVIKMLLSMPQSVGIAGGRPNSSLYFVGYEETDPCKLIYLDPHFSRPASVADRVLSAEVNDAHVRAQTSQPFLAHRRYKLIRAPIYELFQLPQSTLALCQALSYPTWRIWQTGWRDCKR